MSAVRVRSRTIRAEEIFPSILSFPSQFATSTLTSHTGHRFLPAEPRWRKKGHSFRVLSQETRQRTTRHHRTMARLPTQMSTTSPAMLLPTNTCKMVSSRPKRSPWLGQKSLLDSLTPCEFDELRPQRGVSLQPANYCTGCSFSTSSITSSNPSPAA